MTYKAKKETVRKYYKWTTTPNATIVGSPTVTDGVVSGFSSANYMVTPTYFIPGSSTWEIQFKVTTGSDVTTQGCICEQYATSSYVYSGVTLYIQDSVLRVRTGNGSTTIVDEDTTYSISANTTYYFNYSFNGTQYILKASTDGTNWTTVATVTSTTTISGDYPLRIGRRNNANSDVNQWNGSIDLTQCFVKINNKMWWHGTTLGTGTASDYDFYKDVDEYKAYKVNGTYKALIN